jgi:hypothetical protein
MGLIYTTTRLWFDGRHGQAQYAGFQCELHMPPKIPEKVAELDYCPELGEFEVRPHSYDRKRDMEPAERDAAKRWLERFAVVMKRRMHQ